MPDSPREIWGSQRILISRPGLTHARDLHSEYSWLGSNVMNRASFHKEKILYKVKLNLQVLRELARRSNPEDAHIFHVGHLLL